ncbi:MAG TPA: RICIN domain-containing protein [Longimicrobium sp.]|nr:RICIN domain-containing protein [Longimicrobium sp.]
MITSAWHGKALDVPWESHLDTVHRWEAHGGKNQQWCFDDIEEGAYVIRSFFTGRCIEIPDHSCTDATQVRQVEYSGERNQQWMVTRQQNGTCRIHNRHSGKCLDVLGWNKDDGARVGQWRCKGAANQNWRIEPPL